MAEGRKIGMSKRCKRAPKLLWRRKNVLYFQGGLRLDLCQMQAMASNIQRYGLGDLDQSPKLYTGEKPTMEWDQITKTFRRISR